MNTPTIIFFVALGVFIIFRIRRWFMTRSLKQYTAVDFKSGIGPDKIFLDVRTKQERSSSSIQGSIHIPLNEIQGRIADLNKYRDREIVCYCQSGSRSLSAAALLKSRGFNVANLRGGISEWNFQNLGA